jgi:hypothetical protein
LDLSHLDHPLSDDVWLQSQVDYNLFPLTGTTNYSYQNGKTFWGLYNIGYNYTDSISGLTQYYNGNSTTSVTIGSGQKTITTTNPLPFIVGNTIRLQVVGGDQFIQGVVDVINGTTITFTPNLGLGVGTFNNWNVFYIIPEGLQINDYNTTPQIAFQDNTIPNFFSFSGTPIRDFYFKPSIQIKELYEQIFEQSGYKVESNFFNTSYFERYYLPLKFNSQGVYSEGLVEPCYTFEYSANTPNQGVLCNNVPFSADTSFIYIPSGYSGSYTFDVYILYEDYFGPCPGPNGGSYELYVEANGTSYLAGILSDCDDEYPGTYTVQIGGRVTINIVAPTTINLLPNVGSGTILQYALQIQSAPRFGPTGAYSYSNEFPPNDFKQIDFITSVNRYFNFVCVPDPIKPNTIIVEPMIDYIGKGETLDWTEKVDFDSPISLTPTTSYINGTYFYNFRLDQDFANQQYNISNNRIFGTYELQLNQDYKDARTNFDLIFSSPVDVALNNSNLPNITISNFAAVKSKEGQDGSVLQQFQPYKILPRIIFRGLVLPNDNWGLDSPTNQTWWAETYQLDRWQETNRFTTYPFSYTGFSHYINWNAEDTFDPNESTFPTQQDMYDIYYYDYISDLLSPENKILNCKIYLKPYEIANLRFDEKIRVRNSYFRINKIGNFDLTSPTMADVELIKLTKDYVPHPVKYFDLINCTSGGTDYHTTSDLNYNIFAYVGNYVNIFTGSSTSYTSIGCFQVVEGQPNPNYDYDQVYIGSGYTSSGVGVYNNCGCTGRTQFEIVQQNYPQPSQAPILTPTPTPTNTGTPASTPTNTPSVTPTRCVFPQLQLSTSSDNFCVGGSTTLLTNVSFTPSSACSYCEIITLNSTEIPFLSDGTYYVSDGTSIRTWTKTTTPSVLYNPSVCYICPTPTPTNSPTPTITPTPTNTGTPASTPTMTSTPTQTNTPTQTGTPAETSTPTVTPTNTMTPTNTQTPTNTPSETPTNTPSITPTNTGTPTNTPTVTSTPTPSGGAAWTPAQLSNLWDWWTASSGVGLSGTNVISWSGYNNNVLTRENASFSPLYQSTDAAFNNQPSIRINPNNANADCGMDITTNSNTTSKTWILIGKVIQKKSGDTPILTINEGISTRGGVWGADGSSNYWCYYNGVGANYAGSNFTNGQYLFLRWDYNRSGGVANYYQSNTNNLGNLIQTFNPPTNQNFTGGKFSVVSYNSQYGVSSKIDIVDVIFVDGILSAGDVTNLQSYITSKYAL